MRHPCVGKVPVGISLGGLTLQHPHAFFLGHPKPKFSLFLHRSCIFHPSALLP